MKSRVVTFSALVFCLVLAYVLSAYLGPISISRSNKANTETTSTLVAAVGNSNGKQNKKILPSTFPNNLISVFGDAFSAPYVISEAGMMSSSNSSDWWISSGGYFYSELGTGATIQGSLPVLNPWRVAFLVSNAIDSDNGFHPQNIFRLVLKNSKWKNATQQVYFKITNNNLSESPNRNASNGLLLFNHYQDEFNLYYTGIRVDGYAVIKKKTNGRYYTMDYKPVFTNSTPYDNEKNPNLIPSQQWIGLKSEIVTNSDNTVHIRLFIDKNKTGNWVLVAESVDDNKSFGGDAISAEGHGGIRTDFMDVKFDDYYINKID